MMKVLKLFAKVSMSEYFLELFLYRIPISRLYFGLSIGMNLSFAEISFVAIGIGKIATPSP